MAEEKHHSITDDTLDIAEVACKHISKLVTGNGVLTTDVKVINKEQDMFALDVNLITNLRDVVSEKKIVGNKGAGEECSSKEDMQQKVMAVKAECIESHETLLLLEKTLKEMPFSGWGKKQKIVLKELSKDYIYTEQCQQCKGSKKSQCSKCHGKGNIACFNCKGFGLMECLYCNGMGQLPDGKGGQKECHKCYGKRKAKCTECQGKKYMICDLCRGSKYIPCKNCAQTGYLSVQTHVEFSALTEILIDESSLPTPVLKLYEAVSAENLAKDQHAKVTLMRPANQEEAENKENNEQVERKNLYYKLEMPIAKAEFSIGEKRYQSDIVGYQSYLSGIDDFLDPLVKPGIKALQKMSQGPMAQKALIDTALRYRLIKQVFSRIGKMTNGRIFKFIKSEYPNGLSDKYAKAVIQYSNKAISKITEKPRMIAMGIGITMALAVFGAWFFVPLRKVISSMQEQQQMLADFSLMAVISYVAYYIIRLFAGKALEQFMMEQKQNTKNKQALPPAGNEGIYTVFASIVIFIALAYFAPLSPSWLQ